MDKYKVVQQRVNKLLTEQRSNTWNNASAVVRDELWRAVLESLPEPAIKDESELERYFLRYKKQIVNVFDDKLMVMKNRSDQSMHDLFGDPPVTSRKNKKKNKGKKNNTSRISSSFGQNSIDNRAETEFPLDEQPIAIPGQQQTLETDLSENEEQENNTSSVYEQPPVSDTDQQQTIPTDLSENEDTPVYEQPRALPYQQSTQNQTTTPLEKIALDLGVILDDIDNVQRALFMTVLKMFNKVEQINTDNKKLNEEIYKQLKKLEINIARVENKITTVYEVVAAPKLKNLIEKHYQLPVKTIESRTFKKDSTTDSLVSMESVFQNMSLQLQATDYERFRSTLNIDTSSKLSPDTASIQINYWIEMSDQIGLIEGTMSNLLEDDVALRSKLLQLERQIVFVTALQTKPNFIGFVSPSLTKEKYSLRYIDGFIRGEKMESAISNIYSYLCDGSFRIFKIGTLVDLE
jgi:iron-sulfur cluster repair protein YtfE (RIC family)